MKIASKFTALAAMVLSTSAFAATLTYGPTVFGPFASGSAGSFSVPQFDPSLGTLLSVELFVTGGSNGGSNGIENFSAFAGSATAAIGSNISVAGPAALTVLTFPATSATLPVTAYDGTLDFGGTSGFTVAGLPSVDSQSATLLAGFGAYIGLSTVNFNYSSSVNTSSSSTVSPAFTSSSPPEYSFDATVIYTFSAIPEPTALGALAPAGLLLARRRRA